MGGGRGWLGDGLMNCLKGEEDEACWEVGGGRWEGRYWAVDSPSPITPCRASKTQNNP